MTPSGEMAEAVLDGIFCQCCGEFMGSDDPDWQPAGHPVTCAACRAISEEETA